MEGVKITPDSKDGSNSNEKVKEESNSKGNTKDGITKIPCKLKLGICQLFEQDANSALGNEENLKRCHQKIDFIRSANAYEETTIQEKIDEIKKAYSNNSIYKDLEIIGIPSCVLLPDSPAILTNEDHMSKIKIKEYLDKNLEDILHQQILGAVEALKFPALVIQGFRSDNVLGFSIDQAKNQRTKESLSEDTTPDLNKYELHLINILGNNRNMDKEVTDSVQLHKQWKEGNFKKLKNTQCLLFDEECYF